MDDLKLERENLEKTTKIINELLDCEQESLEKMFHEFFGTREELWKRAEIKKTHIKNLEIALNNPYFARIDFTYDDTGEQQTIYIGKNGIMKDSDMIVTDWRAPISSLYYDSDVGKCSFEAPSGTITGDLSLKRQYEIDKGILQNYFDVDLVSNDSLLQKYLNTNNDARLKSIVATIQKEQNEVIRKKMEENVIIQGVAGSGKTTVALHKIAYLVYNYINHVRQNQYLVIGPNPVFMKYIKSVLPDLDVTGVKQFTFEDFAKNYIEEDIKINSSENKINSSINGSLNNDIDKFKCSRKYKEMLDQFLEIYFLSITSKDLELDGFKILSSEDIKKIFDETVPTYNMNFKNKIEMIINRICRHIENNNSKILDNYNHHMYDLIEKSTETDIDTVVKKMNKGKEEIRKNCRNLLKRYFSKVKVDTTKLYKIFVSSIEDFNIYDYKNIKTLKKETLLGIKNETYDFSDLAALIYIKNALSPDKDFSNIKHVVIDEAQDLGEFDFIALKKALPSATFSIFGDLAQSIYDYRGIDSWEDVNEVMFENKGQIINFNKSYRTTSQIMNVADDVADSIGLNRSDLVVREGVPVSFSGFDSDGDATNHIINKIKEYQAKGYKNIAVISKTDIMSNVLNADLVLNGLSIPNLSVSDDLSNEKFRICTLSNQLSKGLEFDAVIISDAGEEIYSSTNSLDMKLLYVAITRALHELEIVYTGELTKPLQNSLEKSNNKVLKKIK